MIGYTISAIDNNDDRHFIEQLYIAYKYLIYSEISQLVTNPSDIEEITHDVMVKMIGKIPKLRTFNRDQTVNYLLVSARNAAKNFLRKNSHVTVCSYQDDENWKDAELHHSGDDWVLAAENEADLMRAWHALDERNRRILEMKYVLDASNEEIAQELGVKPDSIRMLLTRAKRQLKELLG